MPHATCSETCIHSSERVNISINDIHSETYEEQIKESEIASAVEQAWEPILQAKESERERKRAKERERERKREKERERERERILGAEMNKTEDQQSNHD